VEFYKGMSACFWFILTVCFLWCLLMFPVASYDVNII
jgi:hypothetical protein